MEIADAREIQYNIELCWEIFDKKVYDKFTKYYAQLSSYFQKDKQVGHLPLTGCTIINIITMLFCSVGLQ